MYIRSLSLTQIRNHRETQVEFERSINVFAGRNGQGKTSVLEAISLCCLTKTFVPCDDKSLVGFSADVCSASMTAESDYGIPYKISVGIPRDGRKRITSSSGKSLVPHEVIGQAPIVVLSPDYKVITAGTPQDRRTFLDTVLSQSSASYMADNLTLKRVLKQRNALLLSAKQYGTVDTAQLDLWTDALVAVSSAIVSKRSEFLQEFSKAVCVQYASVSGAEESIELRYMPSAFDGKECTRQTVISRASVESVYRSAFAMMRTEEIRRGTTAIGPHKDEIMMMMNGGVARECASQGQHKSLLIALKRAEFDYLYVMRSETPIVLLDDIFSELDARRSLNVLELMQSSAQTFVTTTDAELYTHYLGTHIGHNALFTVERGSITRTA
jgi:DNA replication and repair protein RecF